MAKDSAQVRDPSGSMRSLAGGLSMIVSMFLVVPGINQAAGMAYQDQDGDILVVVLLLGLGGVLFLTGLGLLLAGAVRRRAYGKRTITYGEDSGAKHPADEAHLGGTRRVSLGQLRARIWRPRRDRP